MDSGTKPYTGVEVEYDFQTAPYYVVDSSCWCAIGQQQASGGEGRWVEVGFYSNPSAAWGRFVEYKWGYRKSEGFRYQEAVSLPAAERATFRAEQSGLYYVAYDENGFSFPVSWLVSDYKLARLSIPLFACEILSAGDRFPGTAGDLMEWHSCRVRRKGSEYKDADLCKRAEPESDDVVVTNPGQVGLFSIRDARNE
jgi:hypothetical protein